jgi:T-complex protein 1 subunit theta
MALPMPSVPGYVQMMKEGSRHYAGLEEAVLRNVEACTEFARTLRSAYGPRGLSKLVINHIDKLFVTSDAATIISQLEIQHPAARMMVMASQMQEQEVGDGTNFVILIIGALLEQAGHLIKMGLKPVEIVEGYEVALQKIVDDFLPQQVVDTVQDVSSGDQALRAVRTSVMSKHYGNEDFLSNLIVDACRAVHQPDQTFNVDNVRVCKILGSGMESSQVVHGMVFKRAVEGTVTRADAAKIVVLTCPLDISTTETKGTVLLKTADELLNFSRGEEDLLEQKVKLFAEAGVKVVVSGGKFGDMALHYCNKYGLMAVRLMSKFDVRRVAKAVRATVLPRIELPKAEEMGFCDSVFIDEIGDTPVVIFKQKSASSKIATIVVRGSTDNVMDDMERAVDDGINTFKGLTKDGRLVAGAGAVEMELASKVASFGETLPGMEQYAVQKFAEALQSLPTAIADNAGIRARDVITDLTAEHASGKKYAGIDLSSESPQTLDAVQNHILDLYLAKYWGLKYATSTACTILQVDQIICAKAAGGPKPRDGGGDWDQD